MDKLIFTLCCLILSLVLGASWGGFFLWLYPSIALPVGLTLFVLCFLALMNADKGVEEEKYPQDDRQLNDI